MNLEPLVPGSIKDRIVCCVWALGELATPARLRQAVNGNDSIVAIAIESLQRDAYMHLCADGYFVLDDDLGTTLPKPADAAAIAIAEPSTPAPRIPVQPSQEVTHVAMKVCKKCQDEKTANEANFGADTRTKDGLGQTCSVCKTAANSKPKSKKKAAPAKKPKPAAAAKEAIADELVIPAAGQISCRVMNAGAAFVFQQGDDQIIASLEQLQIMRDWSSSQVKKHPLLEPEPR